jgi:hypothetical protein
MSPTIKPSLGLRVRFLRADHDRVPLGMTGTIDVVHEDGEDFWVATDCGGFFGWTSFRSWEPLAETAPAEAAAMLRTGLLP